MTESTAVAPLAAPGTDVVVAESTEFAAARKELARIREVGLAAVERQKSLNNIARMLEGCQWGDVKGKSLSVNTRYAIARICDVYNADPLLHIFILGGQIYRNAQYWTEQLNGLPDLKDWWQLNISASYSAALRDQAKAVTAQAKEFDLPALKDDALALLRKANEADERRAFHGIPTEAVAAYETLVNLNGRDELIREANYAPHKNDPVGASRPHETAKTRSLRRAAVKASPSLRSREEENARDAIEGEFEIVDTKPQAATLQIGDGEQVVEATGEIIEQGGATQEALPQQQPPADAFDYDDARKQMMATWKDAGVKDRKVWSKDNGFPESIKDWVPDQYRAAYRLLLEPVKARVRELAGAGLEDVCLRVLKKAQPMYLKEWNLVLATLELEQQGGNEAEEADEDDQGEAFPREL